MAVVGDSPIKYSSLALSKCVKTEQICQSLKNNANACQHMPDVSKAFIRIKQNMLTMQMSIISRMFLALSKCDRQAA